MSGFSGFAGLMREDLEEKDEWDGRNQRSGWRNMRVGEKPHEAVKSLGKLGLL